MRTSLVIVVWAVVMLPALWVMAIATRECNPGTGFLSVEAAVALISLAAALRGARGRNRAFILVALVLGIGVALEYGLAQACEARWSDSAGPLLRLMRTW